MLDDVYDSPFAYMHAHAYAMSCFSCSPDPAGNANKNSPKIASVQKKSSKEDHKTYKEKRRDKDDPSPRDLKAQDIQNNRNSIANDDHVGDTGSCRLEEDDTVEQVESKPAHCRLAQNRVLVDIDLLSRDDQDVECEPGQDRHCH